jgi:MFS family permease
MDERTRRPQPLRALWRAVFWVSFPFGILWFVLPVYGRELGATALEVGVLFSVLSFVPVVVRPFLGRALDRWGRRPFLLMGLGGYVAAVGIFCLADTIALLTVARFVEGLGQAFLWLSAYTAVADLAAGAHRGHSFGLIDEASMKGMIIGALAGFGFIVGMERWGYSLRAAWPYLFAFYMVSALVAFWNGWRGIPETRPLTADPIQSHPVSGQLIALMGIVFATGASSAMIWPLLMLFLQDNLRVGVGDLALAYLPAALVNALLPSRMGRIADRWGRKGPMMAGLAIGALASALIPQLRHLGLLAALWALESLGYCTLLPAERAFVADIAGEDVRGTSYGLYTFAYFLGAALGPLAGGWLYDGWGHAMPFYLNAGVLVLGAFLVAAVLRETRRVG